jgi:general stress protein 26
MTSPSPPPADLAAEMERRVRRIVWCTMATVDTVGRPRTRIVHPWWEGTTAWVTTRPGSPKTRHLATVPAASLLYWDPAQEVVMAECGAVAEEDAATRARVWEAIAAEELPYGFDPAPIFPEGPADPAFHLLRLEARRIELAGAPGRTGPAVWRRSGGA